MMFLFSCLSQKSSVDAVHQETRQGVKLSAAKAIAIPSEKNDDRSLVSPKGTARTSVTESLSPGTSSLEETLDGSLEVILHSDDDKFLEFVEQIITSTTNRDDRYQQTNIPPQIHVPSSSLDPASPVSTSEAYNLKALSIPTTAERLDQIYKKVLHLQFENDAMKAINLRLFQHVKKLRAQIKSSFVETTSLSSPESLEESKLVQELSEKLSKQEAQLEKQRAKYEKLKIKLTEKGNACKSLLKGRIITEDSDSIPHSITTNPDAVHVERLHFEKEIDVLELEVRCLQKELATALDQVDHLREVEKRDKQVIEALQKQLNEKNALIESLTQTSTNAAHNIGNVSSPPFKEKNATEETGESQASAAQDMLQELSSLLQFKQEEKVKVVEDDDLPSMSKYLQLRKLQKELSSAQRQIRDQQRELKTLASSNGISEFMKIWRTEKESLEKRILELEHELQRSIRSKHDASFYSAEESSISSNASRSISSQASEKSPRPISPSYFLNAQVGWPPINLELLQGMEIRRGSQ